MARPAAVAESSEALEAQAPTRSAIPAKRGGAYTWFDDRLGIARLGKHNLRKIFPDHWSFLLGEIVLYSFIVCLLSGVFLTIWFRPSMAEVEYTGAYSLMRGIPMSEAFASTLTLSFDVRGGLLVRQVHHWAAILFIAGGVAHALRIFFTGAFRKPREINWVIGVALMGLSLIEGFAGYSLPDDLLSGTGLRFTDGLIRSIPLVGTWAEFLIFDGEFPGTAIVPRLYMAHILLIPGILLGLIAAHMALIVYHKHTQFPGPGRTEQNVVGYPLFPVYMAKAGGFFFVVFGVTVLMGGLMQINPVWKFGPYNPAQVTAGSQPDWYMGWVEGAIRIVPNWESHIGGTTWSWNIFLPGVGLLTSLFVVLGVYPFIEQWITGDKEEHHLLDRPRNAPTRTALGVAGMTLYAMFWLGGSNDIIATTFSLSLNGITYFLRAAVFIAPVIAFILTKRICLSLQRRDRERVLHGSESGEIERSPEGNYSEAHVPISEDEAFTLTQHKQYDMLDESDGVSKRRARASRFLVGDEIAKPTAEEIEDAHHHDDHDDEAPALPRH
ncbi:cytochrome b [Luteococcus sp. OSA5]|uniref:cytochrome bc1 complex cytochrome b subunit n=1 Tax=Luteococcus sp. OSA5 TaxID=3401630 RepID=UPI003B42FC5A